MTTQESNRRDFIKTSATSVSAVAAIAQTTASAAGPTNSNSKLRIGFIGPGGRGFGAHVKRLTKLQVEGQIYRFNWSAIDSFPARVPSAPQRP